MPTWKSFGKLGSCALILWGCGEVGLPLPFVDNKEEDKSFAVQAKVRDFKEGNATDNSGTHPHFNQIRWICEAASMGATVEEDIATDGAEDASFPGDNRTPRLSGSMPDNLKRCFEPLDRFSDWYNDKGADVNRPYLVELSFEKGGDGRYRFRNDKFFPLDNGAAYRKIRAGIPDPFGHLQTGNKDEVDLAQHNYGFTMEFHARFKYVSGRDMTINVKGDDDVWIYINGKRVLDLGGTHPAQTGEVKLDNLGLNNGGMYTLDFFFAERSVASSNLTIETNFGLSRMQ